MEALTPSSQNAESSGPAPAPTLPRHTQPLLPPIDAGCPAELAYFSETSLVSEGCTTKTSAPLCHPLGPPLLFYTNPHSTKASLFLIISDVIYNCHMRPSIVTDREKAQGRKATVLAF